MYFAPCNPKKMLSKNIMQEILEIKGENPESGKRCYKEKFSSPKITKMKKMINPRAPQHAPFPYPSLAPHTHMQNETVIASSKCPTNTPSHAIYLYLLLGTMQMQ